ncbi:MAG: GNAT family N-acetyltransferase [Prolixibacteraceae bacterium]|nr:GNAT family N-acetyltransferase [Prolixibacteraceae bacterium]
MEVIVLPAVKSDLKEILELQKKCYLSEAAIYNDYYIPPLTQEIDSVYNEFENGFFLKAVADNKIVGSVRAYKSGETCFIGKLIVDSTYRNNGIGQELIKRIEEYFNACKRFELFTGHKSMKNLYLYKKMGYEKFNIQEVNQKLKIVYLEKEIK